jgi:hypothetical protein
MSCYRQQIAYYSEFSTGPIPGMNYSSSSIKVMCGILVHGMEQKKSDVQASATFKV